MQRRDDCYFRDKTLRPGEGHGWRSHDHAVATLVLFGRLEEEFGAGRQCCGHWELHYKPLGARHVTATGPDGVRMFLLALRGPALERLRCPTAGRPRVLGCGVRAARALGAFLSIAPDGFAAGTVEPTEVAVERLWNSLHAETASSDPMSPSATKAVWRPTWITEAHELIAAEDGERFSLGRLARRFGVHPVSLARGFRRHYGRSVAQIRRRTRIDRAVQRLTGTRAPLADLALELGYADQSHFSREFKRETDWTPGRFRRAAAALGRPQSRPNR